ncbi:12728_t:CDS:2, partial [Cetraspora pellucida]
MPKTKTSPIKSGKHNAGRKVKNNDEQVMINDPKKYYNRLTQRNYRKKQKDYQEELEQTINHYNNEFEKYLMKNAEIDDITKENESLKEKNKSLKEEMDRIIKDKNDSLKLNQNFDKEVKKLREEIKRYKESFEEIKEENKEIKEENEDMYNELEDLRKKIQELQETSKEEEPEEEMFVQDIVQDECQTNIVDDNISTFDTNTLYINDNPINNLFGDVLDSENSITNDSIIDNIVLDNSDFTPFYFDNNSYNSVYNNSYNSVYNNDKEIKEIEKTLSLEQKKVIDVVINKKKSLFFTGPGGCGKTYTLNFLIKKLHLKYGKSKIGVTSSTGISALNIDGTTLHGFTKIGVMDKPFDEIIEIIKEKNFFYNRWLNIMILIIDEISMIDVKTFEFVDHVARVIRENEKPFGGIQLVLSGDFFQLKPVKGEYVFMSEIWNTVVEEYVLLKQQFRQKEINEDSKKFIKGLNDIRF